MPEEVIFIVASISTDKNITLICDVGIKEYNAEDIGELGRLAKMICNRVRHNYTNLVFSPQVKSNPDIFEWDDTHGSYSRL